MGGCDRGQLSDSAQACRCATYLGMTGTIAKGNVSGAPLGHEQGGSATFFLEEREAHGTYMRQRHIALRWCGSR
jgi:hypothetical protein